MQPRRIDGADAVGAAPGTSLVAIGNFDGVHRGHQAVLGHAAREAAERGLRPLVLTFHPHPARVLGREGHAMLTTIDRRIELVARIDPALGVVVQPFTKALSELSPREFASSFLAGKLGAKIVIVGENFRFGHDRAGDLATLERLGNELGFEARPEELEGDVSGTYSSSRARALLAAGEIAEATQVLGRPHSVSGVVVAGEKLGRELGFPTANLGELEELLPADGIYACAVDREDGAPVALGLGAANLGVRPTLGGRARLLEVHLLDLSQDLYGARLRVHFIERLRGEERFESLEALREQIARDVDATRRVLAGLRPDPALGGRWF